MAQRLVLGDVASIKLHTHWPLCCGDIPICTCRDALNSKQDQPLFCHLLSLSLSPAPSFLCPFTLPTYFCSLVCLPSGNPLWLQPGSRSPLQQRAPVLQSDTDKRVSAMNWRPGTSSRQIIAHQLCNGGRFFQDLSPAGKEQEKPKTSKTAPSDLHSEDMASPNQKQEMGRNPQNTGQSSILPRAAYRGARGARDDNWATHLL